LSKLAVTLTYQLGVAASCPMPGKGRGGSVGNYRKGQRAQLILEWGLLIHCSTSTESQVMVVPT